uniref:Uncharacterized protein n=1 Tax=Oryza nivara TaxID=4536 RepID=A0A0E0FZC1_ORYNI
MAMTVEVSGWRGIGRLGFRFEFGVTIGWLAGLAFMFSTSILLQILACALYNNWWPMLAALMYVLVPMPCLFFGGGSTQFLTSRDGGGWFNAAKFLTGASAMGSIAIPAILRHAGLIETGAMFIEFTSFFILLHWMKIGKRLEAHGHKKVNLFHGLLLSTYKRNSLVDANMDMCTKKQIFELA